MLMALFSIRSKMLFYRYIYEHKGNEYIFYAKSRDEADKHYKDVFKVDIVRFLRREPW
jgi:hypothetical protein